MKALVTGSAGFIGRHMEVELQRRGWEVWGYDLDHGDDLLYKLDDHWLQMDLVVHCAYHVGGRASIDGTNMNFAKNLQLDSSLFEWAVRTKQKRVLYFSSSAVYPTYLQQKEPYKSRRQPLLYEQMTGDNDSTVLDAPDSLYGLAKITGEKLAQNARDNGVPVTVVRPFSGYSEDQSLDYPFPSIIKRVRNGDLSVWGPPGQTRDWIHVDDVVRGALAVVESGTEEPVNLCTGVGTEMGELACKIATLDSPSGTDYRPERDVTYDELAPTGVFYRVGDPERMKKYYEPKVSLTEGIRRALAANL